MVTAVTGMLVQFSSLGLPTATIQAPVITHGQCSNLFWINAVGGGIFSLIVCLASPAFAWFYDDSRLGPMTLVISLCFLLSGLTVQHEALLLRQMKQPQISANRLFAGLASTAIAVLLALAGFSYWALVWREVIRGLLTLIGVGLMCPWLPGLPSRNADMGRFLTFGRDLTLAQILTAAIMNLDSLLIGRFAGPVALGLYRQAYNLITAPVEQLNRPIFGVSQPGLSMLQGEPDRYRRYYLKVLFIVSIGTVPLGVFSIVYAHEIVSILLGPGWTGAVNYLRIFGVAASIRPAVGTSAWVLITSGKSGRSLVSAIVHSIVLAILMILGVRWGAVGVAVAQVSTSLLLMPWKLQYSFKGSPIRVRSFLEVTAKPALATVGMSLCLVGLRSAVPVDCAVGVSLIVGCVTAVVSYFGCLALIPGSLKQLVSLVHDVRGSFLRRDTESAVQPVAT
jgi:PST family polysaccharide transporter